MMKHSKRFLCLLLTLILAASLCVFPAAAADQTCPSSKDDPVVFVHGLTMPFLPFSLWTGL